MKKLVDQKWSFPVVKGLKLFFIIRYLARLGANGLVVQLNAELAVEAENAEMILKK